MLKTLHFFLETRNKNYHSNDDVSRVNYAIHVDCKQLNLLSPVVLYANAPCSKNKTL